MNQPPTLQEQLAQALADGDLERAEEIEDQIWDAMHPIESLINRQSDQGATYWPEW